MKRVPRKKHPLCKISGLVCFVLLTFSDLRILYAPFEYAPTQWVGLIGQGITLCAVHIFYSIFITKSLGESLSSALFLIISSLSVNTAMWAVAREMTYTIAFEHSVIKMYPGLYVLALISTIGIYFFALINKKKHCCNDPDIISKSAALVCISTYFCTLQLFPLYQCVEGTHLCLLYYVYTINRFVLVAALLVVLLKRILERITVYQNETGRGIA